MHKLNILILCIFMSFNTTVHGQRIYDSAVKKAALLVQEPNNLWYTGYVGFVLTTILGCIYVAYNDLKSAYDLYSFVWQENEYSSTDHMFNDLNSWSVNQLSSLNLNQMNELMIQFLDDRTIALNKISGKEYYQKEDAEFDAFSRFNLYQFPLYRKLIRQFIGYKEFIFYIVDLLQHNESIKNALSNVQGFKPGELVKLLLREKRLLKESSP